MTNIDGQRYVVGTSETDVVQKLSPVHGFVVDTKPDNIPALITDYLYIGSQDCAVIDVIKSYNITHVVSLGIDAYIEEVSKIYIECLDLPETDIKPVLREVLPFIKKAVDMKRNVLVHCNAGVSRTSMVAIAYLIHYNEMEFRNAYDLVKSKRPAIQPNSGFRNQLQVLKPGQVLD